jgi:hypothetical protein
MNPGPWRLRQRSLPELSDTGKIEVGLRGDDTGTARLGLRAVRHANNHASSLTAGQLALILGVAKKAQRLRAGTFDRCQRLNLEIRVAMQLAA